MAFSYFIFRKRAHSALWQPLVLLFIASPHPIKDRVPGFPLQLGLKWAVWSSYSVIDYLNALNLLMVANPKPKTIRAIRVSVAKNTKDLNLHAEFILHVEILFSIVS